MEISIMEMMVVKINIQVKFWKLCKQFRSFKCGNYNCMNTIYEQKCKLYRTSNHFAVNYKTNRANKI